ncbi:hypothetical protein FB451DRAFT_1394310 [Mycena latifolia]|nr:hypothetical protein FB451DRAFT_1394310 [Mycena latifolia]
MVQVDVQLTNDPPPPYDLFDLIASLTLEDDRNPRRPSTPDVPAASGSRSSQRTLQSAPTTPTSRSTRQELGLNALYCYTSPSKTGVTKHWWVAGVYVISIYPFDLQARSEAAEATQGISATHVQRLTPHSPRRRSKKAAYVVFRGRITGVFPTWKDAEQATSGVRFSLHQGYLSHAQATAAFEFARLQGWTSDVDHSWANTPISSSQAPLPVPSDGLETRHSALSIRLAGDPWYVVYAGINPGVFPTYVECALNVLGIRASVHESVPTYDEARAKFQRASDKGDVAVRRACET